MNRYILRAGIVLLCLTILLLLAVSLPSPLLYGPENATSTPSHVNPLAFKKISRDESSQILPIMQEVLDGTG
ncbi:MAG: hypothetical protein LUQ17_04165, partial [Methanomicrobiales archaeon]|nr:hypothetical protein [Methanomicrobiales archaeon]